MAKNRLFDESDVEDPLSSASDDTADESLAPDPTDEDTGQEFDDSEQTAQEINNESDNLLNSLKTDAPERVKQDSALSIRKPASQAEPVDESDIVDEAPAPQASSGNPELNKYKNFMDEYRRLQEQRRKGDLVTGLVAAGGKIGQSIAGKYSGKFDPDMSGVQMLQKMDERPVQDFEQGQVVQSRGMELASKMDDEDPTSSQSKMIRKYFAEKLGMKLDDDVSFNDAKTLLKTMGRPAQTKFQKVNGTVTDADGNEKRISAIFDPSTGSYKDATSGAPLPGFLAEGLNPFQVVKGEHGEQELFNKSRGRAPTPVKSAGNFNSARTPNEVYAMLKPDDRTELNKNIIPTFNKLTEKTQQRLMHQAPIMAKLEEAQLNPAALAQLQAEMARFDVGDQRLAQQEFNMFATRHGYKGWGDWVQKNSTGTISADFAGDFAHTINNTVRGMQEDLNKQAERQAQLVINRLPPGQKVDPKVIAPLIYSGYKPTQSESKKKVLKKGYNPTSNKTQLIYDDGTKEIVDGRQ